uniref:Pentraxin family member n=1 Tax=Meleagris gallopavo TaxID=9103 RepID=G1NA36_MELGA
PTAGARWVQVPYLTMLLSLSSVQCGLRAAVLQHLSQQQCCAPAEAARGLWELSFCTWLLTPAPHLGTVLSYTSEAKGSKLALHGDHPGSACFVIGDTEFRQLSVTPLLDGKWHHLCLTWSSSHGQYRFYVDRRLLAAGSGFQQGYEVPAGGSLVLGQQQSRSGDFVPFLGQLAGLALWSRVLLPGEVASMATGQGLPHGPLLTLANATLQGEVRRGRCACLQNCP